MNDYITFAQERLQHDVLEKKQHELNLALDQLQEKHDQMQKLITSLKNHQLEAALLSNKKVDTEEHIDLSVYLINLISEIKLTKLSLESIKNLSINGQLTQSNKPTGLTRTTVLIIGIILSFLLSLAFVFLIEFIKNSYNSFQENK
ncbi:hypothetical protein L3V79_01160 [Thiotrichales bacterium 19S9-12]|nr:hypothetical protein [Thiotrichales bacterium 19S9-11]MCF6810968.1 hypothetical protein [Thiotrichales bacterium 19S9-12]